jgi:fatty acid amide hydrolase
MCSLPLWLEKNDKMGTRIAIPSTIGPIARTVDDCALFMKAVCTPDLFAGDSNVPPLLFDDKAYKEKSKLKIGYFKTDNWFEPCATSRRALDETLAALQKAGHECIPFEPPTDGWHNYAL